MTPPKGGTRPGAGRKPKPTGDPTLKVTYSNKIQKWIIDWLQAQDRPAAQLIEEALMKCYKLKPPAED